MSDEDAPVDKVTLLEMTTDIVAAYAQGADMSAEALQALIRDTYATFSDLAAPQRDDASIRPDPAIPIEGSVTDDYIYCLEDGLPFKSLKRHIRSKYDMTPEAYRLKWGLPLDYPMVAPNYAKERSALAKKSGLGKTPRHF